MEALGLTVAQKILLKVIPDCGAVLGPSVLMIAALRFATTMLGAASAAALLVFALSAMAGELFNPFFFSPFALYPVFIFSFLFPPDGGSIFFEKFSKWSQN